MYEDLLPLVLTILLLALGFVVGRWREWSHLRSLDQRERDLAGIAVTNCRRVAEPQSVDQALLVSGDAVIATDYFKSFVAAFRNIVGGEMRSYQSLMTRARREATLRMLEEARRAGATEVYNVRLETSNIRSAGRRSPGVSVEVFAFGTAVVRRRQ